MQIVSKPEWITLTEAAEAAGRSYAWARDRAATGVFEVRRGDCGKIFLSAESLANELQRELARHGLRKFAKRARKRPHLRLIVDNSAK